MSSKLKSQRVIGFTSAHTWNTFRRSLKTFLFGQ